MAPFGVHCESFHFDRFRYPKILVNKGGFLQNGEMLYHKTNRTASTMLRSVIKHLGSEEKRTPAARVSPYTSFVSPYTSFVLSSLPACFIAERSTVEAVLFVK